MPVQIQVEIWMCESRTEKCTSCIATISWLMLENLFLYVYSLILFSLMIVATEMAKIYETELLVSLTG